MGDTPIKHSRTHGVSRACTSRSVEKHHPSRSTRPCGEAVSAGGFEAGVAHEFDDQDDVVAGANEVGSKGVAWLVAGEFPDAGVNGEGVEDVIGTFDR